MEDGEGTEEAEEAIEEGVERPAEGKGEEETDLPLSCLLARLSADTSRDWLIADWLFSTFTAIVVSGVDSCTEACVFATSDCVSARDCACVNTGVCLSTFTCVSVSVSICLSVCVSAFICVSPCVFVVAPSLCLCISVSVSASVPLRVSPGFALGLLSSSASGFFETAGERWACFLRDRISLRAEPGGEGVDARGGCWGKRMAVDRIREGIHKEESIR